MPKSLTVTESLIALCAAFIVHTGLMILALG